MASRHYTVAIRRQSTHAAQPAAARVKFAAGNYLTGRSSSRTAWCFGWGRGGAARKHTTADYRNVDPFIDGVGAEMGWALVGCVGRKNVGIEGPGAIAVAERMKAAQTKSADYKIRPSCAVGQCTGVRVSGLELRNSGGLGNELLPVLRRDRRQRQDPQPRAVHNDGIDIVPAKT